MIEKLLRDVSSWNQMKTFAGLSPFTSLVSEHFKQWLIHIKQHCNGNSTSFFFTLCFSLKNMGSPQSFPEIDVLNQPFDSPSQIHICTFLVCISSENEYIYIFRIFTDRWNSYDHLQTEISSSNRVWRLNSMCSAVQTERCRACHILHLNTNKCKKSYILLIINDKNSYI